MSRFAKGFCVALDVTEPSSWTSLTTPMTSVMASFCKSPSLSSCVKLYLIWGTVSSSHYRQQSFKLSLTGSISVLFSNVISYSLLTVLNCFLAILILALEMKNTLPSSSRL